MRPYVSQFNLNCGCTKRFTAQGEYGAVLMRNPKQLVQLVSELYHKTRELNIKLSVKLRMFDHNEDTIDVLRQLTALGIQVTVHTRHLEEDRDTAPARNAEFITSVLSVIPEECR